MGNMEHTVVTGSTLCHHTTRDAQYSHHGINHGLQHSVVMGGPTASDGKHHDDIHWHMPSFKTVIFCIIFLVHLIMDSGEIHFYIRYPIPDQGELSDEPVHS